ncbi:MAG: T9SS type A sorting domain-containing protein [Flavobacterium sp.]
MANDDYFNNPLSPSAMNPSVLDNDTVNGVTATVTSSFSNVTVSFVSMGGINVPTEAEFSTITGGYHYSDFLTPNGKYYMNSGMFPPGTYYLTYKITQNSCPDNYSIATATIIYGGTSSTGKSVKSNQSPKENELPDIIAVYPNPSNGIFNIDLTHVKESYNNIRVYNILGAKIYEGSLLKSLNQIDLSNVPTGYYVAHISGEENSTTVKLIKN